MNEPLPIVMACGIARFDNVREHLARFLKPIGISLPESRHYFKGIRSHLEEAGHRIRHTKVSFAADVETRASDLQEEIGRILLETESKQVHLITHSMGGLDARHMIVRNESMASAVHSLTTIGTPHWGSPVADYLLEIGFGKWVSALKECLTMEGVHDLTTEACRQFNEINEATEAENDVIYQTWSSCSDDVFWPLQFGADIVTEREGPNDGLVSRTSQRWKPVLEGGQDKIIRQHEFPFPADHLNQLGWWGPADLEAPFHSLSTISRWKESYRETEQKTKSVYQAIAAGLATLN